MKVGITGTRRGVWGPQLVELRRLLLQLGASEVHHGDCIGFDAQAHAVARELGLRIVIHPPEDATRRAFCTGASLNFEPRPYMERNRAIVHAVDILLAAPRTMDQDSEKHSGTWATVRYALKAGKKVRLIEPPVQRDAD
jgi:hypothetical protein